MNRLCAVSRGTKKMLNHVGGDVVECCAISHPLVNQFLIVFFSHVGHGGGALPAPHPDTTYVTSGRGLSWAPRHPPLPERLRVPPPRPRQGGGSCQAASKKPGSIFLSSPRNPLYPHRDFPKGLWRERGSRPFSRPLSLLRRSASSLSASPPTGGCEERPCPLPWRVGRARV